MPAGPFDVVVSPFDVHHLDGVGRPDLFHCVAAITERFVLGDVVVSQHPDQATIPIDLADDRSRSAVEQLARLDEPGFDASARELRLDVALFIARRR